MASPYAMNQADWMQTQPSPYQQNMMGGGQPMMAPNNTSFRDMAMAQGAQQAQQAGMAGGLGGARGGLGQMAGSDQQKMAQALRSGVGKLGDTINPYLPTTQQATAGQYGTNPYSDQSLMLAQQNQGLM